MAPRDLRKLPFGLRDGVLLSPSDVERGAACGCVCPGCGEPLLAKKGEKVVHHFAHAAGVECARGVETALHLAAKEAIAKAKRLWLPPVSLSYGAAWVIAPGGDTEVDEVRTEVRMEGMIPDIVAVRHGHEFLIEVAVTHFVDEAKLERIRKRGLSTLEIDLSGLQRGVSVPEVSEFVVDGQQNKKWLFNAKAERLGAAISATARRLPIVSRGMAVHVDDCPLPARVWRGKPYANVTDDCSGCEFASPLQTREAVHCLGHLKVGSYEEWKEWREVGRGTRNIRGE